jgi:serine/threonine protein kinase
VSIVLRVADQARIPGYELGEELGRGGLGVVHAARRLSDDTRWAVKLLLDSEHGGLLRAEARKAGQVRHPGVLRIHEVGERDGLTWLVMPLIEGPDLSRLGPLSPAEATDLICQVAEALSAVHAAGLLHRDVKPANILVEGGRALLADLGLAAPLPAEEVDCLFSVQTGTADVDWTTGNDEPPAGVGTLAYMSPEQWRGEPATERSDIYALGGTLYTALTGKKPFNQSSLPALAYAVGSSQPPKPSTFGVPTAFDTVIATAMAKNPTDRYPTAAQFATALRNAAAGRSPVSRPRRRWLWTAAVAVVALLAAGGILLWSPAGRTTGTENVTRVVCARTMTLRDHPGTGGRTLRVLPHGEQVTIDRSQDQGAWSFARVGNGQTGWVLNQFLRASC